MGLIDLDSFPREQVVRNRMTNLSSLLFLPQCLYRYIFFLFLLLHWVAMQQRGPCQDVSVVVFQGSNKLLYKLLGLGHLLRIIQSTLIDMVIAKLK